MCKMNLGIKREINLSLNKTGNVRINATLKRVRVFV
jgi:hypothetical protein